MEERGSKERKKQRSEWVREWMSDHNKQAVSRYFRKPILLFSILQHRHLNNSEERTSLQIAEDVPRNIITKHEIAIDCKREIDHKHHETCEIQNNNPKSNEGRVQSAKLCNMAGNKQTNKHTHAHTHTYNPCPPLSMMRGGGGITWYFDFQNLCFPLRLKSFSCTRTFPEDEPSPIPKESPCCARKRERRQSQRRVEMIQYESTHSHAAPSIPQSPRRMHTQPTYRSRKKKIMWKKKKRKK